MRLSRSYRVLAERNDRPTRPVPPAPPPRAGAMLTPKQLRRLTITEVRERARQGDVRCQMLACVVEGLGPLQQTHRPKEGRP